MGEEKKTKKESNELFYNPENMLMVICAQCGEQNILSSSSKDPHCGYCGAAIRLPKKKTKKKDDEDDDF